MIFIWPNQLQKFSPALANIKRLELMMFPLMAIKNLYEKN